MLCPSMLRPLMPRHRPWPVKTLPQHLLPRRTPKPNLFAAVG
jgi:hypothetical protein